MDSTAKYIDEEKDVAFLVGFDKGKESFVLYLLQEGTKTLHQIADIAGVTVSFVKSIKQKLAVN